MKRLETFGQTYNLNMKYALNAIKISALVGASVCAVAACYSWLKDFYDHEFFSSRLNRQLTEEEDREELHELIELERQTVQDIEALGLFRGLEPVARRVNSAKELGNDVLCMVTGSALSSRIGTCHADLTTALSANPPMSHHMVGVCVKVIRGEQVRVFFPLDVTSQERAYTPVTNYGMDMFEKVEPSGGLSLHPVPDFRNGMKFNLTTLDDVVHHVHVRFSSYRDGDYLVLTFGSLEYGVGAVPLPTGLRLRFSNGYQNIYARGYSLNDVMYISVCTGPYIGTVITDKELILARMRSGKKEGTVPGTVQITPNVGFIDFGFQKDGASIPTEDLTHLVSLVGTGGYVTVYEILPKDFVNYMWPSDGMRRPEVEEDAGRTSPASERSEAINNTANTSPASVPHHPKDAVRDALPEPDASDYALGSSLTKTDGDITRVACADTLMGEVSTKGRQVAPSLVTKPSCVPLNDKQDNVITHAARILPYVKAGPEPNSKEAKWVQQAAIKAIDILFGKCKHTGAIGNPLDALEKAKSSVVRAVTDDANSFIEPTASTFLKGETIGFDKASRNIVSTHAQQRVLDSVVVSGLVEASKESFYYTKVYGFKNAEDTTRQVQRLHTMAEKDKAPIFDADVEKLDASITWIVRWIERYLGNYIFHPKYHGTWAAEHERVYSYQPHMKGVNLNIGYSRRSGEGGTSFFNSALGAIIMITYLLEVFKGDVKKARMYMGVCGGDDASVVGVSDPDLYRAVALRFGVTIVIDVRPYGTPNQFLAIWYSPQLDIFYPDIARYLSKGFINNKCSVDDEVVIRRRAKAMVEYWGDNIPLMSAMANAVIRLTVEKVVNEHDQNILNDMTGYRLRSLGETKLKSVESTIEYEAVCQHYSRILNIPLEKLVHLENRYNSATSFEDFPHGEIDNGSWSDTKLVKDVILRSLVLKGTGAEVNHPSARGSKSASKNKRANAKKDKVKNNRRVKDE